MENAATLNLTVIPADREFFAPTPFLALSRASTTANWAIAKVNSFNRSTGVLAITLEQVTGAGGPYTDWIITSLPGATLLQKSYYEQTLALRQQVAGDKEATAADRQAAVAANNAAQTAAGQSIAAKDASQQAYADMRKAIAEPLIPPTDPVVGQIWWDGSITRIYDGVGYVPTVTTSIGGRRFEKGTFGPSPDGVIMVGGGFTAALVFLNGSLLREGDDYTANSPNIVILSPQEGDEWFVEAYLATDATDYDTKEQVNQKIAEALGTVPRPTTANVGAAIAGANGKQTPADGDFFAGVEAGGSTMFKTTWANTKAALKVYFDTIYQKALGFVPVRQGGFAGASNGIVSVGWGSTVDKLVVNVDATNFGSTWPIDIGGRANGGATYADRLGNGGWTLDDIISNLNWRVSDTRFNGYIEQNFVIPTTGDFPTIVPGAPGYVVTGIWMWGPGRNLACSFRQPQINVPAAGGWRPLGSW